MGIIDRKEKRNGMKGMAKKSQLLWGSINIMFYGALDRYSLLYLDASVSFLFSLDNLDISSPSLSTLSLKK